MSDTALVCLDRIIDDVVEAARARRLAVEARADNFQSPFEAAGDPKRFWAPGVTLRVCFLDGAAGLRQRVLAAASTWTDHANLTFAPTDDPAAEIRVTFDLGVSQSLVGTDCRTAKPGEPTMALALLAGSPDLSVTLHARHEFGHALGLVHEHQNPAEGIQWNKDEVYRAMAGPPNHWDRPTVDRNYFERYGRDTYKFTEFDPDSVMLYAVPKAWTLDRRSFKTNSELSALDRTFIADAYPGRAATV